MMLTPEDSIRIQHQLGADITMVLDECTPYPATHEEAEKSMELSMRWAVRSKEALLGGPAMACSASSRAVSMRICATDPSPR